MIQTLILKKTILTMTMRKVSQKTTVNVLQNSEKHCRFKFKMQIEKNAFKKIS